MSYSYVWKLVAAAACWGIGTVVSKQALDDFAPLVLLPVQLLASGVFLAVVLALAGSSITWSAGLTRLAALGMLNPGLAYALGLLGLSSITASLSVLLWAAEPVLILLLAAVLLRERVSGRLAAAIGAAVVGVVLVVYQPGARGATVGVALTLAAVTACALYTVAARRLLVADASLPAAFVQQGSALLFALSLCLVGGALGWGQWTGLPTEPTAWLTAVLSGILYYGLAFWLYLGALHRVPAGVAAAFLPLIPVFGVTAGMVVGERLTAWQWAGAAVVILAVSAVAALQIQLRGTQQA